MNLRDSNSPKCKQTSKASAKRKVFIASEFEAKFLVKVAAKCLDGAFISHLLTKTSIRC